MATIDNPYAGYRVCPTTVLTPREHTAVQRMRSLGGFMSNADKSIVQKLISEGRLVKGAGKVGIEPISKKKPGVGVRKRPDVIKEDNETLRVPFSISYDRNGIRTVTGTTTKRDSYLYDYKVGSLIPTFEQMRIKGYEPFIWLQPTRYIMQKRSKKIISYDVTRKPANVVSYEIHAGAMSNTDVAANWNSLNVPASVRNEAILKMHSDAAQAKVDVMTFAAEAKSSVSMISSAVDDLLTIYKSVRSGNMRRANKVLRKRNVRKPHKVSKRPDERWLQYQYGWAPLIGDVTTGLKAIADNAEVPLIFSAKGSVQFKPTVPNATVRTIASMGEFKIKCYYLVKTTDNARKMAQWNLSSNPLLTAWELVPYSFVVDWFVPIGDFLGQYSSTDGLIFISGTEAWKINYSCTKQSIQSFTKSPTFVEVTRVIREDTNFYQRNVLRDTPKALPYFKGTATIRRIISSIALLTIRR